jgi:hypothetical protein
MQNRPEETLEKNTFEINNKQHLSALIEELHDHFSISQDQGDSFALFPFSNELGFWKVIKDLKRIEVEDKNKKGALIFGESNILTLLPHLEKIVEFILLADIEPKLHSLNKHMINCFEKSESIEEYFHYYRIDFPKDVLIDNQSNASQADQCVDALLGKDNVLLSQVQNASLRDYHFLKNKKRFDRCKQAFKKLTLVQIQLNLEDKEKCSQLASIIKKHDASIILCNVTNIHDYVDKEKLSVNVPLLLSNPEQCLIMYAKDLKKLRTTISMGLVNYFRECLKKDYQKNAAEESVTHAKSLFFYKEKNRTDEICYVGFYKEYGGLTKSDYIKQIIDGTANINDYCNHLHAHDTIHDAETFILEKIKQQGHELSENLYWIFSARGNKDKINQLLRYSDDNGAWHHDPLDYDGDGKEFSLKILKVINDSRTTTITNENRENKLFDPRMATRKI